jgi:urease accessory protein
MSRRNTIRKTAAATMLLAALSPSAALAHPGHELTQDLVAGLVHPLTGLDHVLMIVAVSGWATLLPTVGRLVVTASLALFVGAGALLPLGGGAALEAAIALTLIGAGILFGIGRRWPLWATAVLGSMFALIHGFAHGAEGPAANPVYAGGLMLTTASLALAASFIATQLARTFWWRLAGMYTAAMGVMALTG